MREFATTMSSQVYKRENKFRPKLLRALTPAIRVMEHTCILLYNKQLAANVQKCEQIIYLKLLPHIRKSKNAERVFAERPYTFLTTLLQKKPK